MARLILLSLLVGVSLGCRGVTSYEFRAADDSLVHYGPPLEVRPVVDVREGDEDGAGGWWLIPAFPPGKSTSPRPEQDARLELELSRDIAETLRSCAAGSKMFSGVFVDPTDDAAVGDRWILDGVLNQCSVTRSQYSYFIGFAAIPLWLVGARTGTARLDLDLKLTLKNPRGEVAWESTVRDYRRRSVSLYANRNWRELVVEDLGSILRQEWARQRDEIESVVD